MMRGIDNVKLPFLLPGWFVPGRSKIPVPSGRNGAGGGRFWASRFAVCLIFAVLAATGSAQQPLPDLKVDVDGTPVEIGPVMLELNTYLIPLREATRTLTKGRASLHLTAGQSFELIVD